MPTRGNVKLPVLHIATPPQPELFPPGSLVALRNCPGPSGVVRGVRWGKVLVKWTDLNVVGRHNPRALVLAADADEGGIK